MRIPPEWIAQEDLEMNSRFVHMERLLRGKRMKLPDARDSRVSGEVVSLGRTDLDAAMALGRKRLHDRERKKSPTRTSADNLFSQFVGAAGEIAVQRWAEHHGLPFESHFVDDTPGMPDIFIRGIGFEIMTGQLRWHRKEGFCVPPGKLAAARQRAEGKPIWGYLFVAYDKEAGVLQDFAVSTGVALPAIDRHPAKPIKCGRSFVDNHVVAIEDLRQATLIRHALVGLPRYIQRRRSVRSSARPAFTPPRCPTRAH